MCRFKLATYWQNFTVTHFTQVKILQTVLEGLLFFDSHYINNQYNYNAIHYMYVC